MQSLPQMPVQPAVISNPPLTNRPPILLHMDTDEEVLTEYQVLLRKQIELFEANEEDIKGSAQGRNTPIILGQVGIRCRFCSSLTSSSRPRGAVYYSQTIDGIYQGIADLPKLDGSALYRLISHVR